MMGSEIIKVTVDILRGVNNKVWGGVSGTEKVSKIVKTGISGADVVIGTSHAIEDVTCQDYICATLDIIGCVSSAVGLIVGNIPATKYLTTITGSVTVGCRSVRYYCKNYGTVWGCTIAAGQGIKAGTKFVISKK